MMNDKIKKAIREYLEEASSQTILDLVNEIYNHTNKLSYLVWEDMENFDELCQDMEPYRIANCIFYGDFWPNDNYFRFDDLGNFESCNVIELDNYDIDAIIEAVETIPENCIPSDIKDIIEEAEEEEEYKEGETEKEMNDVSDMCNKYGIMGCEGCPYNPYDDCYKHFNNVKNANT